MSKHVLAPNAKLGIVLAVLSAMIYGWCPAPARAVYADGANMMFVALASIFCRALCMSAYSVFRGFRLFSSETNWKRTLLSGLFQALSVIGIMGSLAYIESAITWVILFSYPLFLLMFQMVRGEHPKSPLAAIITLTALGGLAIVLDVGSVQSGANTVGVLLAFMGAVATTFRFYIYGKQMETMSPVVVGAENFIVALALLLLASLFMHPVLPQTLVGGGWMLVSVISMTAGSFLGFYGVGLMGSFRWSLLSKMEIIFVTLFSTFFFNEILKTSQYLGMLVVMGCLVAYQYVARPKKVRKPLLGEEPL